MRLKHLTMLQLQQTELFNKYAFSLGPCLFPIRISPKKINQLIEMRQLCSLLLINHLCISFPLPKQYVLAPPDFEVPDREVQRFVLPVFDHNLTERTEEIEVNREGYVYGPALLGNTSFFPTGVLGDAMVDEHKRLWFKDVQYVTDHVNNQEIPRALNTLMRVSLNRLPPLLPSP